MVVLVTIPSLVVLVLIPSLVVLATMFTTLIMQATPLPNYQEKERTLFITPLTIPLLQTSKT
jgi:hypothetical protein